jgi:CMP-N-acetylneuraminic acid synthetase
MIIKNGKQYKITAIIPARGGSKRIPGKNIKIYAGQPLIYWSIKLALDCEYIDNVVVSTDSVEIQEIAIKFGAQVPFLRPSNISGDLATDYEFMKHYLDYVVNAVNTVDKPNILVQLRPTYPNRTLDILNSCITTFTQVCDEFDSLRTVCRTDKPPYKMYRMNGNTLIPLFDTVDEIKEPYNMPAQLLPETFWHNGYIDILNTATISKQSVTGSKIYAYLMDKSEIDDIDTDEEWLASETKFLATLSTSSS